MPTVAEDTLAYCTKCKMDLNHVICSMKGDRAQKVKCHTCGGTHQYKAPKGITEPPVKAARKSSTPKANPVAEEWKILITQHADSPQKKYSPKTSFSIGDRLLHTQFAEGIVQRLIFPNKVEVIFETDVKILIHAGAAPRAVTA